ncbi:hypothetical protein N8Z80_02500 [Litorivicinus sp.]|nr:hypothetical protein [Litorivicinus sp.]
MSDELSSDAEEATLTLNAVAEFRAEEYVPQVLFEEESARFSEAPLLIEVTMLEAIFSVKTTAPEVSAGKVPVIGNLRLIYLNKKPSDPAEFSWLNKAEVYALGFAMSVIAYPLYPEIAHEHLMLYSPFEGETKKINDDFFLKSTRVRKAMQRRAIMNVKAGRMIKKVRENIKVAEKGI